MDFFGINNYNDQSHEWKFFKFRQEQSEICFSHRTIYLTSGLLKMALAKTIEGGSSMLTNGRRLVLENFTLP